MRQPSVDAERWLKQAAYDLAAAVDVRAGHPALACFLAQQSSEKALKAALYARGERVIASHSVLDLLGRLGEAVDGLEGLRSDAADLDKLYIPTRYPDGLPGGVPAEVYSEREARDAIAAAERIMAAVRGLLGVTS